MTEQAGAHTPEGYWEAHSGEDYSVVMRPNETTDNPSIMLAGRNPNLAAQIAVLLNAALTNSNTPAMAEELERLRAEKAQMLVALKPFADILTPDDDKVSDGVKVEVCFLNVRDSSLLIRHLRRARAAILAAEGK